MNALDLINYQTQLANTAHQREVADLRAAGLNPVLSAHGSGADTPNIMSAVSALGSSGSSAKSALALQKASPVYKSLQTAQDAINTVNNIAQGLIVRNDALAANFANLQPSLKRRPTSEEAAVLHNLGSRPLSGDSYDFVDFINDTGQSAYDIFGSYSPQRLASGNIKIKDLGSLVTSANRNFQRYAADHPKKAAVLKFMFPLLTQPLN